MREPRPDWSPLGVNFKILDEHPYLFNISIPTPPPPPSRELIPTNAKLPYFLISLIVVALLQGQLFKKV